MIESPGAERPILFRDKMVRALLANTKTQTRRIVNPQPTTPDFGPGGELLADLSCPYGSPGSRLWVRECWSTDHAAFYPHFPIIYRADGYDPSKESTGIDEKRGQVWSSETQSWYPFRWRPSIFCRRMHSRITLEIVSVRMEHLQDITEEDAIAEGMERNCLTWNHPHYARTCPACVGLEECQSRNEFTHDGLNDAADPVTAREAFRYLWDVINGDGERSWDANPWVWRIGFRRLRPGGIYA